MVLGDTAGHLRIWLAPQRCREKTTGQLFTQTAIWHAHDRAVTSVQHVEMAGGLLLTASQARHRLRTSLCLHMIAVRNLELFNTGIFPKSVLETAQGCSAGRVCNVLDIVRLLHWGLWKECMESGRLLHLDGPTGSQVAAAVEGCVRQYHQHRRATAAACGRPACSCHGALNHEASEHLQCG